MYMIIAGILYHYYNLFFPLSYNFRYYQMMKHLKKNLCKMNIKLYDYVINGHDIACYKTTCLINLKWSAVSWKLNVTCSILKIHSGDDPGIE